MNDIKFALRQLRRHPGFTWVAIVTLALGLGANTALFSLVNAIVLRPLPYADPGRLVTVCESNVRQGWNHYVTSLGTFRDWREQAKSFVDMGAIALSSSQLNGPEGPEHIQRGWASASYFTTLGVKPILGRVFGPEEDERERADVVILSEGLWRRRFGADPGIIGRSVMLGDRSCEVVGVMPGSFKTFNAPLVGGWESGAAVDLWWPLHSWPAKLQWRAMREYLVVGRLKPGVTMFQAQGELDGIARRLAGQFPEAQTDWGVKVAPLHGQVTGNAPRAMFFLLGSAGLVLLIACANIASLLLARAAGRRAEFAIRAALGAGRGRVMRQLLTESTLLSLLGASVGWLVAVWLVKLIVAFGPRDLPRLEEVSLDWRGFGFTLLLALVTGALFGLVPAINAVKADLAATLKDSVRGTGRFVNRAQGWLVVSEVALALVLVTGAALLGGSLLKLSRVDPGYDPGHVVLVDVPLSGKRYNNGGAMIDLVTGLNRELASQTGLEVASTANGVPLARSSNMDISVTIEGRAAAAEKIIAGLRQAGPRYFEAMGIKVTRGRAFNAGDTTNSLPVVIVNEAFARRHFPGLDPLGQRLRSPDFGAEACEIVGESRNVRHTGLDQPAMPEVFRPHLQSAFSELTVVARSRQPVASTVATIRRVANQLDPNLAVFNARAFTETVSTSLAPRRQALQLVGGFGAVALLLALVGVHGVISCVVNQRTCEFGVRAALGARPIDLLRLVYRQGLAFILPGIALGLLAAAGLTKFVQSFLFGIHPLDPRILASASLSLLLAAAGACWLPARRAAKADPVTALRSE